MKRETLFLKIVVMLMGLPVLAICIFVLPKVIISTINNEISIAYAYYIVVGCLYATACMYFVALYQTHKLLSYIDRNIAFSELSVQAIKRIKQCALLISGVYVVSLPFLFLIADDDDAPGLILYGVLIGGAALAVAVFAAVLQKLLNNAIAIQSENDLTI
ncbi:DUF2975 domain-containing protein [Lysinibacillus piscis]|uniref:Membrane protein n=1 Tax=Lysinibacillus piscis TaxID=2518931 RepID=A0ABQ5NLD0_9BACI|nr:DUF2975 domain-containing protein [Lysinibacillus sp. KH24]GLC88896.1 membrane protein [Lysinibacillus sp. KH24]